MRKHISIGAQLYTVREIAEKDIVGTLVGLAEMGYEGYEFSGWSNISTSELMSVSHDLGLTIACVMPGVDVLEAGIDAVIDRALELGTTNVACPWMPEEKRKGVAGWVRYADWLESLGARATERGCTFSYHHHDFEFALIEDSGKTGLDIIVERTSPQNVKLEIDVYWALKGGMSPSEHMLHYSDRCSLIHLKDMLPGDGQEFAEVGQGIVDMESVVATAYDLDVEWMIVEQDVCKRSPMESLSISMEYIKSMGWR